NSRETRGVDAQHPALRIHQWSAGQCRMQFAIQSDQLLHLSPYHVRQGPPSKPIAVRLTLGTPSTRPTANAKCPTFKEAGLPKSGRASMPPPSILSIARSVVGSRPARVAGMARPSDSVSVIPSSRRTVWLAVTTTSLRQWTPPEGKRRRPCTVTTAAAAFSAAALISADTDSRIFTSLLAIDSLLSSDPGGNILFAPESSIGRKRT